MNKPSIILALLFLLSGQLFAQQSQQNEAFLKYIDKYKVIAVKEMERAGIPASIKLAQGLLESNAGRSTLARKANNHFGMKCGKNWKGRKIYREDDDYDETGKLIKSCFRGYKKAEACYVAHSEFLRDPNKKYRYGRLFRLDPYDYKAWAKGLKDAGYATSGTYTQKLISIIERYELYKFDKMSPFDNDNPVVDLNEIDIFRNNSVRYAKASADETLAEIAKRTDTTIRRLLQYNDGIDEANSPLKEGEVIYLQPKRNGYRGKQKYHYVTNGQTLIGISQTYGIDLGRLMKRNRLKEGMTPAPGETLKLRGWCKVKNRPKLRTEVDPEELEVLHPELEMEEENKTTPEEKDTAKPTLDTTFQTKIKEEEEEESFMDDSEEEEEDDFFIIPDADFDFDDDLIKEKEEATEEVKLPKAELPLPLPPTKVETKNNEFHTVVQGETLWALAKQYNTTVDQIKKINKLKSNELIIGMKLKVK